MIAPCHNAGTNLSSPEHMAHVTFFPVLLRLSHSYLAGTTRRARHGTGLARGCRARHHAATSLFS
ncbi:protein of unknown function [Candidatus Promineifilum breve]|uniref:Uncharacterized protein n=1 Tax=Candidatus Promineifilum breve TaxID=1806508 RepID=A0A160T739_9CHLR|nr:protein of unknown function [Candidatus Promineifilum breve]